MKEILFFLFFLPNVSFCQKTELIPYQEGKLFGYCDYDGNIVIKPAFIVTYLPFQYNMASVRISINQLEDDLANIRSVFIDTLGNLAIKDTFTSAWNFQMALVETSRGVFKEMPVAEVIKGNNRYYINQNGEKINQRISEIQLLRNNSEQKQENLPYTIVYKNEKQGIYYNEAEIIPPIYDYVNVIDFEKGIFEINYSGKIAVLNLKNKENTRWYKSVTLECIRMNKDGKSDYYFVTTDSNNKQGVIDDDNNVILENLYKYVTRFDDENKILLLTAYTKDDSKILVGLFNLNNKTIVTPKYQQIELSAIKKVYKVLIANNDPYTYREFFINDQGREFYKE